MNNTYDSRPRGSPRISASRDPVDPALNGTHAQSADGTKAREAAEGGAEAGPAAALASAIGHIGEVAAGMQTLLVLRAERRQLAMRRYFVAGVVVVLVGVALLPLIAAGVSLLVAGMAQGFAVLWGNVVWLGNITTGVVILGGVALLVWAGAAHVSRKALARKVAEYGDVPEERGDAASSGSVEFDARPAR